MPLAGTKKFRALALVVHLSLIAAPLQAQDAGALTDGQAFARAVGMPKDLESEEGRVNVIAAFSRYCAALKNVFPTNSPSENEWVFAELQAGGDRPLRAFSSKEWGRVMASRFTRNCEFATQLYNNDPSARPQAVFILIETAAAFAKDAERVARLNGLNPDTWAFFTLGGLGVETLARIGVIESNLRLKGTDVVKNVGN